MKKLKSLRNKVIKANSNNLRNIIESQIAIYGFDCDLNHIDVSYVQDMSNAFYYLKFNGDISHWNVENVKDMTGVFQQSKFNGDISKWNVENVTEMASMFHGSQFDGDISNWNVQNLKSAPWLFAHTQHYINLNKWNVVNLKFKHNLFFDSKLEIHPPWWYVLSKEFDDEVNDNVRGIEQVKELENEITGIKKMYLSIEEFDWLDIKKSVIWKKRLNYALQEYGNPNYKIPKSIYDMMIV